MSMPTHDSTYDSALRHKREAIVLEHMNTENAHDFERCISAFSHPRYEIMASGEVWDGHDGVKTLLMQNVTGFPDFKGEPQSLQHGEHAVFVEARFRGTHNGEWRGIPPTGRKVDFPLMIIFVFEGDRMVCERTYFDQLTILRQLGVVPEMGPAGTRVSHEE
jgi:steroid delta-isomerase-like uncharacterized protein